MPKTLSPEKQQIIKQQINDEYKRMTSIPNDKQEKIDRFINKFKLCERLYKIAYNEYEITHPTKKTNYPIINMNTVPATLKYVGYSIDKDLLTKIFGSMDIVGKRSAKKIRNGLTHELTNTYINELINREDELHQLMDDFLQLITNN